MRLARFNVATPLLPRYAAPALGWRHLGPALFFVALAMTRLGRAAATEEKVEELSMVVGEELAFSGVREFAIENQQILAATVAPDKKSVIVRALRPGGSKVLLRSASVLDQSHSVDIVVSMRDPKVVMAELEDLLRPYPGLKVRNRRSRVLIEGQVKTAAELGQLRELERRFDGQLVSQVTVGPSEEANRVMIRLDLHHVAVRRRFSRKLGLSYPASISGGSIFSLATASMSLGSTWLTQSSSVISDLLPRLDLSEANGDIKIKRTDTLITVNGARAVYREGSELPVRLTGTLGAGQLEKIFYGAELTVIPQLSPSNDAVTLEITADISQRDDAATQDGIPGRSLSHVHTIVYIPVGKSAMLAGVDLRSAGQTRTGLPWLSRIPILGYLFGSQSKEAEASYGVVFITPTLVQQSSLAAQQRLDRALLLFDKPALLTIDR